MLTYLIVFIISMFPLVELRGAIPYGLTMGMSLTPDLYHCDYREYAAGSVHLLFRQKDIGVGRGETRHRRFLLLVPDEGREGRTEAAGEGGTRSVCSTIAVRGNSAAGNRAHGQEHWPPVFWIWF